MKSRAFLRSGFTLAEALLAATVLAIVSASAALPFAAGVQGTTEAGRLQSGVELGEALMEEILARPFYAPGKPNFTPGSESGETRPTFNSIDDFHNFAEPQGDVRDYNNRKLTGPSEDGYYRCATVEIVSFSGQATGDTNSLVRVTVKVYRNSQLLVKLDRLVTRED